MNLKEFWFGPETVPGFGLEDPEEGEAGGGAVSAADDHQRIGAEYQT